MMGIRRLEAHVMGSNRQEAPTKEELEEIGCLKDLDLFERMCKILNTDQSKENMEQETIYAMFQSQDDCLVVSDGHRISRFQASFRDASESINYRSDKNVVTTNCDGREREELMMENLEKKYDVKPPQTLLQKQGFDCRLSLLL